MIDQMRVEAPVRKKSLPGFQPFCLLFHGNGVPAFRFKTDDPVERLFTCAGCPCVAKSDGIKEVADQFMPSPRAYSLQT